jgi:hypothetical protein
MVQRKVASLFPRNPDSAPHPVVPSLPPVIIDPVEAESLMKRMCKHSGADVYGFTAEIIRALAKNGTCCAGILRLSELIGNNALSLEERAATTVCKLLALKKPPPNPNPIQPHVINPQPEQKHQDNTHKPKVRTITLGNAHVKFISKHQHNIFVQNGGVSEVSPLPHAEHSQEEQ